MAEMRSKDRRRWGAAQSVTQVVALYRNARHAARRSMFWQATKRLMANDDVQSELVDGGRLDDGSPRSPSRTMTF
jgi:hypothetical protein